jgi:hypothetical protein
MVLVVIGEMMMNETITVTYVIDSYLKGLTEFNARSLIKESSKVLQMRYVPEKCFTAGQRFLYESYENKVLQLVRLKKSTDEEKLKELLLFVRELRGKIPEEFPKVGWWDRKVALHLKKEKLHPCSLRGGV